MGDSTSACSEIDGVTAAINIKAQDTANLNAVDGSGNAVYLRTCTGTILSDKHILTSATCCQNGGAAMAKIVIEFGANAEFTMSITDSSRMTVHHAYSENAFGSNL